MNSRERVLATLEFADPDRIPRDVWMLPASWTGREAEIRALLDQYPGDFAGAPYQNPYLQIGTYTPGTYTDVWGCEWLNLVPGIIGEVKKPVFADYAAMQGYAWPDATLDEGWQDTAAAIAAQRDKFVLGYVGNIFERMQFLRGTENLYMDLAEGSDEVYALRDRLWAFYRGVAERWLQYDIDALNFSDDWGSQRALLIRPETWREFYKPVYADLFGMARAAGKHVFFHSDGYILDIYPDLIEMGVSAVNSQVWCMGLDNLTQYAGRITFWGEIDRQRIMPSPNPDDVRRAAQQMIAAFYRHGGLIGQAEADHLTSLANIEALLTGWS
jgi:uroporphyrinogen decarboxylase